MSFDQHTIIESVLRGNRDAYASIIDEYQSMVFRYTWQIVKNQDIAEDLTQETFIKAYEKLHQYRTDAAFKGWLLRIARNNAMNYFRKNKTQDVSLDEDNGLQEYLPETKSKSPDKAAIDSEKEEILNRAISQLSKEKREIILLHYYEEMSLAEIAELMDKKTGAIKTAIHRIRLEIREIIESMTRESLT